MEISTRHAALVRTHPDIACVRTAIHVPSALVHGARSCRGPPVDTASATYAWQLLSTLQAHARFTQGVTNAQACTRAGADAVNTPCALNRYGPSDNPGSAGVCAPADGGGTTCLPCGRSSRFGPNPDLCCPFAAGPCGTFFLAFCSEERECTACGAAAEESRPASPCCPRAFCVPACNTSVAVLLPVLNCSCPTVLRLRT